MLPARKRKGFLYFKSKFRGLFDLPPASIPQGNDDQMNFAEASGSKH